MAGYCELELAVEWRRLNEFGVSARFTQPNSVEDQRPPVPEPLLLDIAALDATLDSAAYGRCLSDVLFAKTRVGEVLAQARAAAEGGDMDLRLRLALGGDTRDLHGVRWETLRDPRNDAPLAIQKHLVFSRYLWSNNWRSVSPRARGLLRALVAIANPDDLDRYKPNGKALAPVAAADELARAQQSLGEIPCDALTARGEASLDRIVDKLRDGYDIFYLVCHGAFVDGKPRLWLDDGAGRTALASGLDLVSRLQDLPNPPRLVVLASCQSAGSGAADAESESGDGGALASLGPQLAQAGIPAVLAMQGNITMKTVESFMPVFFAELGRDGRIDRAMAEARARVATRPDWWMPVLFMRFKTGQLWADQAPEEASVVPWQALALDVKRNVCLPILGPGLVETLLGSLRQIAGRMSEHFDFPLAPQGRDDLAQVAQYLSYRESWDFPREMFGDFLKAQVAADHAPLLPPEMLAKSPRELKLDDLLIALGRKVRAENPKDAHAVLAGLPFPVFITANRDNLLRDALREVEVNGVKKQPRTLIARWRDFESVPPELLDLEPGFIASELTPVILHLFGNLEHPETLVISEDDYFDFLIGFTRGQSGTQKPSLPNFISSKIATGGLLFLGFQVDDWDFRVLFRSILMQEGKAAGRNRARVAVQMTPAEGRNIEPSGARKYLEKYFSFSARTGVYWGPVEDFVHELDGYVRGAP